MFLPFISASNVASYFVAEVYFWGRREKWKFSSFLKANSSGRIIQDLQKISSSVGTKQCLAPMCIECFISILPLSNSISLEKGGGNLKTELVNDPVLPSFMCGICVNRKRVTVELHFPC